MNTHGKDEDIGVCARVLESSPDNWLIVGGRVAGQFESRDTILLGAFLHRKVRHACRTARVHDVQRGS